MSSLVADLPGVRVRRIAVSTMDNNVYLLTSTRTGRQVLIDAADNPDAIERLLTEAGEDCPVPTRLDLIVTTHAHWDHLRALAAVRARHPATTAAGEADAPEILQRTGVASDLLLRHGDAVGCDGLRLTVIGLRGHTDGSVALVHAAPGVPVHIFTGDSLFPGGVGNTGQDPDRFDSLFTDVTSRIFDIYPDDTVIHPGHGKPTTLGVERPQLDAWLARGW